jgi:hypothetical protein
MKLKVFLIFAALLGLFYWSYNELVESPFNSGPIDFGAYFSNVAKLSVDTHDLPISRLSLTIFIIALPRILFGAIRAIRRA